MKRLIMQKVARLFFSIALLDGCHWHSHTKSREVKQLQTISPTPYSMDFEGKQFQTGLLEQTLDL